MPVEFHERQFHRSGTGGDHNVFCGHLRHCAAFGDDIDGIGRFKAGRAAEHRDFAGFGELSHAADQFRDHTVLALQQGGQIDLDRAHFDPVRRRMVLGERVLFRRIQERFAGNAANVQASAAKRGAFLHQRDLEAELHRAKSAHVAARAGADDENVKGIHIN